MRVIISLLDRATAFLIKSYLGLTTDNGSFSFKVMPKGPLVMGNISTLHGQF